MGNMNEMRGMADFPDHERAISVGSVDEKLIAAKRFRAWLDTEDGRQVFKGPGPNHAAMGALLAMFGEDLEDWKSARDEFTNWLLRHV